MLGKRNMNIMNDNETTKGACGLQCRYVTCPQAGSLCKCSTSSKQATTKSDKIESFHLSEKILNYD
ncbi:hypothetical protein [Peptacetobacter sp.]|uniref:hypothetical protein n=1 Tax=unclassified Peptacetobacter TaxID=2991974 RepID=UPI00261B5C84|nr:hypothetical protein [Peptacetobacter sp.]